MSQAEHGETIDLGGLVTGGLYQFAGPLAGLNLVCIPDEPTTGA
jgi:hypothetical protein